ncbi:MAG: DHH family phosphoesterase, partial [Candidatus Diapherotrites archaeon]|nr:DHH family phosphoesterase [Candidatus Diapherotrites archaeon]
MKLDPKDCQPAIDFLKSLTKHDKALVLIDGDADGLTSGAILTEYLDENDIQYKPVIIGGDYRRKFKENVDALLKEDDYNTFIMTDWSTNDPDAINDIANQGIKTLVIDHHRWNERPIDKVAYVNPWNETQDYPAAAGLALYIYEEAGGQKDLKWLGFIGCTTDTLLFKSFNV